MLSWLGGAHSETSADSEDDQRHLTAYKLFMKTLSQQNLSQIQAEGRGDIMEFIEYLPTPKVDGVWCYDSHRKGTTCGTLCLTGHNMILYADDTTRDEIWVPYKNVDSVEKRIGMDKGTLMIKCKNLKQYNITIPGVDEAMNVAYSVETLSNLLDPRLQFPYFYRPKFEFFEDGWDLFSFDDRLAKMNKTSERWRISDVNMNFECCRSYGTRIIVPSDIEDDVIRKSAKFRNGGRFPVVSFCHRNNATIVRSSQPLVGTNNRRCKEDERLLTAMLGPSHKGYIVDVRSVQTATQAKVKGGGYEGDHHYSRWKRTHHNLKSYFAQQESFMKVVEACNDKSGNMDRWLSKIESSDWLEYVKRSLTASCVVAQSVDRQGWSVLVHGSEGFDSTLTVTSLAQVILDPECRTIRGFLTLIDREWLQGGHPFTDRASHGPYSNFKQRGEGPVFSIFLECTYQLLQQFPLSFEFTSKLLLDLRHHCYCSPFGTFLFNNVQERSRGKLRTSTVSLWTWILSPSAFGSYLNPLYRKNNNVIWPSVAPQSLEFWDEYYNPDLAPVDPILDRVKFLQTRRTELEIMKRQLTEKTDSVPVSSVEDCAPAIHTEEPINLEASAFYDYQGLNKTSTTDQAELEELSNNENLLQISSDAILTPPSPESLGCTYVPISGDMSHNKFSDSFSVNSQPDLLEDLLSFVNEPSAPNDIDTRNLPDLDDLAIDSTESESPDAVSPTPS